LTSIYQDNCQFPCFPIYFDRKYHYISLILIFWFKYFALMTKQISFQRADYWLIIWSYSSQICLKGQQIMFIEIFNFQKWKIISRTW
jgi:hypothetical protein